MNKSQVLIVEELENLESFLKNFLSQELLYSKEFEQEMQKI